MQNHEYVTQNGNGIMGLNVLYQTSQIQWYLSKVLFQMINTSLAVAVVVVK